ncbi:hypothetical protein K505DRAFT_360843 [Melanomma pulvis-pyrius CBS 109.77]|uniref:ABM domain-containing protein n=1 Tax=Melanomma pulvis-pyrius CBS 109.77 TaxID=1314802 RepID=A0A6A6XDP8_9PLEO|nr:hypothetical protein K505DRAFT_360843 [Melanomma pulvis-pyrius CBS 109.77]
MSAAQLIQIPLTTSISGDTEPWSKLIKLLRAADSNIGTTWSPQEEDSKTAGVAANWTSFEEYQTWTKTNKYKTVTSLIKSVSSGEIYNNVVVFPKNAGPSLGAPTIELVSWIYEVSKLTNEQKKKIEVGFANFQAPLSKTSEAAGGLVGGWSQNDFNHDGITSGRFTALIGWKSVESHYACKKTKPFLDNIHWLMENDHSEPVEMVHYAYSSSE